MQTFLPYPSFIESAAVLDRARLGKQRVEAKQILCAILDPDYGWQTHPATNMWRESPWLLANYGYFICKEWRERGYRDSLLPWFNDRTIELQPTAIPDWIGDPALHASHRSNLLRKDPDHYSQFNWAEPDDLPYLWPQTS